ncbi:MAG: N-acetylglucosamine-6-phosphate deacetylase [Clostridia bacterium]|nr:N-acetylglucosamine-6-phosphate deacetylase [Clostridia bacterium]
MKYIRNGRIVMPNEILTGMALCYDGEIKGVVAEDEIPEGADVIDAEGGYAAPGLVDIHIHGYLGEDASDGKADGVRKMARGVMANGVTSFLPTTMTVPKEEILAAYEIVRKLMPESKSWDGAEILGVNSEGPFINPSKKGAQAEENILEPDAEMILENADVVRITTIAPEMDKNGAIEKIAADGRVTVSIGHTGANFEQANEGFKKGISHVTHLFNAQTPLMHRDPGVVGAALMNDGVTCELIADTFHVNKALFELVAKLKGDNLVLITDCVRAGGMPDGEYTLGGQPIFLKGIECRLADGTIAGSVLRLNQAVKNLRDNTSLPFYKAVACASLNPARVIHMDDKKGSLLPGRDADIIITDDDFNIKKTIIGGVVKYEA